MVCGCVSNLVLTLSSLLYLAIAVVVIAIAGSTFFTDYGLILEPLYAASFLGGGIAIFFLSMIGFRAACSKNDEGARKDGTKVQGNRCSLWLFTILTFVMFVLTITSVAYMFQYEAMLNLAAKAGYDEEALNARAVRYEELYGERGTKAVKALMTNTFDACDAEVNVTSVAASTFTFACANSYFNKFSSTVNKRCFHVDGKLREPRPINGTAGSYFDACYEGDLYSAWPVEASEYVSAVGLVGALNTPKGLYCACADTVLSEWVLPYIHFAKYVAMAVVVFFFLVFIACVHQICKRGCCKPDAEPEFKPKPGSVKGGWSAGSGVQMGYNNVDAPPAAAQNGKRPPKKASKYSNDDFLARP